MPRPLKETQTTYSAVTRAERITPRLLRELTRQIVNAFHPDEIILYGSRAYGKPRTDSDIDLLVIGKTRGSPHERSARISQLFARADLPLDILANTPREVAHRLKIGDPFYQKIIEAGRVLYERGNGHRVSSLVRKKLSEGKEGLVSEELVEDWVKKAEGDFKSARVLARQHRDFSPDNLCWAFEQCVEKYLKAFLISKRIAFDRSHDLNPLNKACMRADSDFRRVEIWLGLLADCTPTSRYPPKFVTEEQARRAFDAAQEIRRFVRTKLGSR